MAGTCVCGDERRPARIGSNCEFKETWLEGGLLEILFRFRWWWMLFEVSDLELLRRLRCPLEGLARDWSAGRRDPRVDPGLFPLARGFSWKLTSVFRCWPLLRWLIEWLVSLFLSTRGCRCRIGPVGPFWESGVLVELC